MAVNTGEALLARLSLTSSCAAWFLTGHGPVHIRDPGVGDPCVRSEVAKILTLETEQTEELFVVL